MFSIIQLANLCFLFLTVLSDIIYVSPNLGCGSGCSGTLDQPFDNLGNALNYSPSGGNVEILLLYSSSELHYLFSVELSGSNTRYNLTEPIQIKYPTIIRPLFCTDPQVSVNVSLLSLCIANIQNMTVYIKSEEFSLQVLTNLEIENIEFSWIEDIGKFNTLGTPNSNLESCLYQRIRCCLNYEVSSSLYPGTVNCSGTYSLINPTIFMNMVNTSSSSLNLTNINFILAQSTLIALQSGNLMLKNCELTQILKNENSYIWINSQQSSNSIMNLIVLNSTFGSTFIQQSSGELIISQIQIINSTFQGGFISMNDGSIKVDGLSSTQNSFSGSFIFQAEFWNFTLISFNLSNNSYADSTTIFKLSNMENVNIEQGILNDQFFENSKIFQIIDAGSVNNFSIYNTEISNYHIDTSLVPLLITLDEIENLEFKNLSIAFSTFTGNLTFIEATKIGTTFLNQLTFKNLTINTLYSPPMPFVSLNSQKINMENIELSDSTIFNLTYFFQISGSQIYLENLTIQENNISINFFWNTALFNFESCYFERLKNVLLISNIINSQNDMIIPEIFFPYFSLLNITDSTIPLLSNYEVIGNLLTDQSELVYQCNVEFISFTTTVVFISGAYISKNHLHGSCAILSLLSNLTIDNFQYRNNENYNYAISGNKTNHTFNNVILDSNNEIFSVFFHFHGNLTIINGLFSNNQIVVNGSWGVIVTTSSSLNMNNITLINEFVTGSNKSATTLCYFQAHQSVVFISNLSGFNVSVGTPANFLLFDTNTEAVIENFYFNGLIKNFEGNKMRLYMSYLFSIEDSSCNITNFIVTNSYLSFLLADSTININQLEMRDIKFDIPIPNIFFSFHSTIQIADILISNISSPVGSNYLFSIVQGSFTFTNLQASSITSQNGSAFSIQNCIFQIQNSLFQGVQFGPYSPIIVSNSVTKLSIIDTQFLNNYGILNSDSDLTILFSGLTIISNLTSQYLIQFNSPTFINLENVLIDLAQAQSFTYIINIEEAQNTTTITNLSITNTQSYYGALHFLQSSKPIYATLNSSYFMNNIAYGEGSGALYLDNIESGQFSCYSTMFFSNQAKQIRGSGGRGGSVSLYTQQEQQENAPTFRFQNCEFLNNFADFHGGAIYVFGSAPILQGIQWNGNTPNNIGSQAIKLISNSDFSQIVIGNSDYVPNYTISTIVNFEKIPTNQPLSSDYAVLLLDQYDQIALYDSSSTLTISPLTPYLSFKTYSLRAQSGIYSFQNMFLYYEAGQTAYAYLINNSFSSFPNIPGLTSNNLSSTFLFQLQFRNCTAGEIYNTETKYCTPCAPGLTQLSNQPNYQGECSPCDTTTMICLGGSNFGPAAGNWMLNSSANIILACPQQNACPGGILPVGCAEGYQGNLCAECIPGYGKRSGGTACFKCQSYASVYVMMVLKVLFLGFFLLILAKLRNEVTKNENQVTEKIGMIRIMIDYIQTISLVCSLLIKWPGSVKTLAMLQEIIVTSQADYFGLDCFFSKANEEELLRDEYVVFSLMPFIVVAISLVTIAAIDLFKKGALKQHSWPMLSFYAYLFYPSATKTALSIFSCLSIYRNDTYYSVVIGYYDIMCQDRVRLILMYALGVPMILLWVIGLPLLSVYFYKKEPKHNWTSRIWVITAGCAPKKLYWNALNAMRKLLLISVVVFGGSYSASFQVFILIYVVWVMAFLQRRLKPYISDELNSFEIESYSVLGILAMGGIYFELVTTLSKAHSFFILLIFVANAYLFVRAIIFFIQRSDSTKKYFMEKSKRFPKISKIVRDALASFSLTSKEEASLSRQASLNAKANSEK